VKTQKQELTSQKRTCDQKNGFGVCNTSWGKEDQVKLFHVLTEMDFSLYAAAQSL
jgi:hypothetical protein